MAAKPLNELYWVEDLLEKTDYLKKPMFGGFAFYLNDKIILALFEGDGETKYKDKDYHFEIWHGCLFPLERENHALALKQFPFLVQHPVLTKWLYLPLKTENFEDLTTKIIRQIIKPDSFWGVIPKPKNKKSKSSNQVKKINKKSLVVRSEKVNMKTPQMFRDLPLNLEKASAFKNIADFKNLGPESEKSFKAAGIKTPQQFLKLGWQKAWFKLAQFNIKNAHTMYGYALIGALENKEWNALSEDEKQLAKDFSKQIKKKLLKK